MAAWLSQTWRKRLSWAGGGVLAALLALVVAWETGALDGAGLWVAGRALGYEISCGRVSGNLLGTFTCADFDLADDKGRFLHAKEVSLDWNAWALLGGSAKIKHVSVSDAVMNRLPKSVSQSNSGFLPNTLIALSDIELNHVTLALPDLPKACMSVGGRGTIGPDGFDAALALARCAPADGRFDFNGHYVKTSGALALSALGHDDGALVAALTGIADAGETTLSLNGKGTVSAFNGRFELRAVGLGRADASFHARDLTSTHLDATFALAPALKPDWAPQGTATLAADIARGPQGGFDISFAELDWGGFTGKMRLTRAVDGALNGAAALDTSKSVSIGGTNVGGLMARATIAGTNMVPSIRGAATLTDIASGSTRIETLQANFAASRDGDGATLANIVGHASGVSLPAGEMFGDTFAFRATLNRNTNGEIALNAAVSGAAAQLTATAEAGQDSGHATVKLAIADLAKAGTGFAGHASAELNLDRFTLAGDMDGTLEAHGVLTGKRALGKTPALTATLHAENGNYAFDNLIVETAAATMKGSVRLANDGALKGNLKTVRGDLSPLMGQTVKGSFSLNAMLSGTSASPALSLAAAAPHIAIGKSKIENATLRLEASKHVQWSGHLALAAATPGGPVDARAVLETTANGWQARIASGKLGPASLGGQLSKVGTRYSGALTLTGPILEPAGLLLGMEMSGGGTLALRGAGKTLRLTADLVNVRAGPLQDATLHAKAATGAGNAPTDLSLTLKDGENHLSAAATAKLNPFVVTLKKFTGIWARADFALAAPVTFAMTGDGFALDQTTVNISGGRLVAAAKSGHGRLSASARLSDMPAAPLATLFGLGKGTGKIAFEFTAEMAPGKTDAKLALNARDLMVSGAGKKNTPANLDLNAQWNGHVLSVDGRMAGTGSKDTTLTASVPVIRSPESFLPKLAQSGPISGHLRAQIRAEKLIALLPLAEQTASGLLSASADVSGDISKPQFSGKVALTDGSFTDYETGLKLEKLNASLDALGGSKAELKLTATDGNSGTVKADGAFSMAALETGKAGRVAGYLDVKLNNASVLRQDLVHAGASGTLTLDLPGDQPPKISGKLRTQTVRVDLGAAIPPAVPKIEVKEIHGGPAKQVSAKRKPLFSDAALDVAITMPNRVYVSGHGADTEWSGDLKLAGTLGAPDVTGRFDLVRGRADFVGKTFTLNEGRVVLDRSVKGGATVHIVGQNETSDLTVTVAVDGPAGNPKLTWSSSPSLPQSEILSRMFFGTSTPHLSAMQAFQLAQLSGGLGPLGQLGDGGGVLAFARRMTGLDVLRVEAPSDLKGTGASVTAGKYINDRVYVGVKQGADISAGTAQVDVKITPHITLDAEAGANSQGALGVSWKWDY